MTYWQRPHWRSHRWLSESDFRSTSLSYPYAPFLQVFVKKKERKSAINGFRLCIDKLLTLVSGLPRTTATSIHPFVQYAKVTLLEISPCQCPTVKRSGVAYSCSYALLINLIIYFKFENQMFCKSALGRKKKTDGSEGDHSMVCPCYISWLLFNLILYDFVQSFFHIFVAAVLCSLPFLELCFILTFSNFHMHFLFGQEKKKKKNPWDIHGHPSPIVKIYFQKHNHN